MSLMGMNFSENYKKRLGQKIKNTIFYREKMVFF